MASGRAVSMGPGKVTPLRELQLVEAHRRGGPGAHEAINELVHAYQRRVYSICQRMVRSREDAADLTQDVLLKMVESLDSYSGQSKLSTWVIRIAMNACLSHLRKQRVRGQTGSIGDMVGGKAGSGQDAESRPGDATGGQHPRSREPLPGAGVEQGQVRSMVLDALDSLDADSKAILVLRDVQDLDYEQLAAVLEVPVGTVKSRLFRARAALRGAIEARGGGGR